ncbi:hypothetical protein E4U03_11900 [Rothia nasimurium]|uniref:Peptidase M26 C-terminal domain-containing protein n=1 Tax=Rothia nasimurium TaxID=85336 RepID=A0A4Y9F088_9MICC|nr:hypothetical protein [Rothia nasimurium]TFU20013.1 hypothetical protein E4U03_11900 [Rothia nasimurium]
MTVRRQAFDLLTYKGYDEGMVPYISNQYKAAAGGALSDSFIMGQTGIADYATDRAARYRQGLERAGGVRGLPLHPPRPDHRLPRRPTGPVRPDVRHRSALPTAGPGWLYQRHLVGDRCARAQGLLLPGGYAGLAKRPRSLV